MHFTSTRIVKGLRSFSYASWGLSIGLQKLGQPVPEAYFAEEWNSGKSQQTHW